MFNWNDDMNVFDKLKRYIQEARERAKRRRSAWNLLLIPLSIIGTGAVYAIQFRILWLIHVCMFSQHANQMSEFWRDGISGAAFVSSFLLAIPIMFSSLSLGLIIANLLAWCVPPARRAFEREAEGIKAASFGEAVRGLNKAALYLVPICFALGLLGAVTLKTLR